MACSSLSFGSLYISDRHFWNHLAFPPCIIMFICSSSVFSTFRCLEKQDKFLILFTSSRLFTQGMYIICAYCTPHTGTCTQPCLTLLLLMDCGPPGSSVHGVFQARTLMWVAVLLQGIFMTQRPILRLLCLLH